MARRSDERAHLQLLDEWLYYLLMEKSESFGDAPVHLHLGSTNAWYITVCGIRNKEIYVTSNRGLVTCDDCKGVK